MSHHCHAEGCKVSVPPRMLMCRKHWFMADRAYRELVWAYYVRGQEKTKTPTTGYLAAMQMCIADVAIKEGKLSKEEGTARVEEALKLLDLYGDGAVVDLHLATKTVRIASPRFMTRGS